MGILDWLFGTSRDNRPDRQEAAPSGTPTAIPPGWACSSCGRSDLPPAGDWDPPICLECDAAINFDADLEYEMFRDD
jgi:hypothetical protein